MEKKAKVKGRRRRRVSKITISTLIGSAITIILFGVIVSFIGWLVFTYTIVLQDYTYSYQIAEIARGCVDGDMIETYLETGEKDEDYVYTQEQLDVLREATNCDFIYVTSVDTTDFRTETYIFDSLDPDTGFSRYDLGYTTQDIEADYADYLKRMYAGENLKHTGFDYLTNTNTYSNHTTAILDIRNSADEIVAIVCVERNLAYVRDILLDYLRVVRIFTLVVLMFVLFFSLRHTTKSITTPLARISDEARYFAETHEPGTELDKVKTKNELGTLAADLRKMEMDILDYMDHLTKVTAEQERLSAELDMATKIQADMLPAISPNFVGKSEFSIQALMDPAREVGGDFYDFFYVDDSHLALVLADVSDKGVPAALFMTVTKALIQTRTKMGGSPSEIIYDVNNQLCEGNEAMLFVTVWLGIVDIKTGRVVECNAGHECPAICHQGGDFELRQMEHDMGLAVVQNAAFNDREFTLGSGDILFQYTDGVTEATNADKKMFGENGMICALNRHKEEEPEELLYNLKSDLDSFVGAAPQFDDVTMLAFKRK